MSRFLRFGGNNQNPTPDANAPPMVPLETVTVQQPSQNPPLYPQYNQSTTDEGVIKKNKGMFEFTSGYPKFEFIFRCYCSVAAGAMMLAALYSYGFTHIENPSYYYLIDTWLVVLGILSLLVEWRIKKITTLFNFLAFKTGRGFFYIFIGSLTLGISDNFGVVAGTMVMVAGLITWLFGAVVRRDKKLIERYAAQQQILQQQQAQAQFQQQQQQMQQHQYIQQQYTNQPYIAPPQSPQPQMQMMPPTHTGPIQVAPEPPKKKALFGLVSYPENF